jgi:hypothetical protein
MVREKFKGHTATKAGILGFVNDTHTTFAKLFDNAVMGDNSIYH